MTANTTEAKRSTKALHVRTGLHQAAKIVAALKIKKMHDLIDEAFRCWLEKHGDEDLITALPEEYRQAITHERVTSAEILNNEVC